jgi:peroxiredoxin
MAAGHRVSRALAALLLGFAASGLVACGAQGPRLAPDFAVTDLGGQAVRLSALRGKVVLLNLWTTWCAPCREEMPSMEKLWARLPRDGFVLLAVSQDEDGKRVVEPFVRQLGLSFPILLDPERQVGDRYGVWGYPETFLIDRNGYIVERIIGPRDWASPQSVAQIEALIAAGGGATGPPGAPRVPS